MADTDPQDCGGGGQADKKMNTFTYTKEFAESIWLPFERHSEMALIITDKDSQFDDFLNKESCRVSETGYHYSDREMKSGWKMVIHQKIRLEKFYRTISQNDRIEGMTNDEIVRLQTQRGRADAQS